MSDLCMESSHITQASDSNQPTRSQAAEQAPDSCVICLEPISERAVAVPCNHVSFDFICLASWASEHAKCPLCNATLAAIEYDWRSPEDYKTYSIPKDDGEAKPRNRGSIRSRTTAPYRPRFPGRRRNRDFARTHIPYGPNPSRSITTEHDAAVTRRRNVYRNNMYSMHVGSNRISQFRDFTPQAFASSDELQQRAKKWIRRELQVFDFVNTSEDDTQSLPRVSNAEFLLFYIVSILKTVDIKGSSGKAEDLLTEFLGREHATLFLHELNAWLRSPYIALEDWDRNVQYQDTLSAPK